MVLTSEKMTSQKKLGEIKLVPYQTPWQNVHNPYICTYQIMIHSTQSCIHDVIDTPFLLVVVNARDLGECRSELLTTLCASTKSPPCHLPTLVFCIYILYALYDSHGQEMTSQTKLGEIKSVPYQTPWQNVHNPYISTYQITIHSTQSCIHDVIDTPFLLVVVDARDNGEGRSELLTALCTSTKPPPCHLPTLVFLNIYTVCTI